MLCVIRRIKVGFPVADNIFDKSDIFSNEGSNQRVTIFLQNIKQRKTYLSPSPATFKVQSTSTILFLQKLLKLFLRWLEAAAEIGSWAEWAER